MEALSYGQIVLYTGVTLITIAIAAIVIGAVAFSAKRKSLKKQLMDKYGF